MHTRPGCGKGRPIGLPLQDLECQKADRAHARYFQQPYTRREPKLPKTETGIRTIGIDEETVRALREHGERSEELAQQLGHEKLPRRAYIFWPYNEGPLVPFAPQSITKMFRTLAGEGGLRPHQLRHFSVTQLLAAGVPEVEVMGRHGHASASSMKPLPSLHPREGSDVDYVVSVARRVRPCQSSTGWSLLRSMY